MEALVKLSRQGAVATVALNRPRRHNAFDGALAEALDGVLAESLSDPATRLVVLRGEGRTFCAGLDLTSRGEAFRRAPGAELGPFQSAIARLLEADKPVVARVHGGAFGAGFGLMVACGVAVAAEDTRFAVTEMRFGLPPTAIPLVLEQTGRLGAARHLLMTGTAFDTATARRCGLVHHVVPADALDDAVQAVCADLLACAPGAYAVARQLQRRLPALGLREGLREGNALLEAALDGEEGREGLAAWAEGRPPGWVPS